MRWRLRRFEQPKAAVHGTRATAPDQNGSRCRACIRGSRPPRTVLCSPTATKGCTAPRSQPAEHVALIPPVGRRVEAGFVISVPRYREKFTAAARLAPIAAIGTWHRRSIGPGPTVVRAARPPDWVRACRHARRIILKHQYGEVLHPYNTIPQIPATRIGRHPFHPVVRLVERGHGRRLSELRL